jgi:hypothetical protein
LFSCVLVPRQASGFRQISPISITGCVFSITTKKDTTMDQQEANKRHQQQAQLAMNGMDVGQGLQGAMSQQQGSAMQGGAPIPPHLMGLMSNPAFASAAASSPLYPPAAMLSNSGAYVTMPEHFNAVPGMPTQPQQQQQQHQQQAHQHQHQQQTHQHHQQQAHQHVSQQVDSNKHSNSNRTAMLMPNVQLSNQGVSNTGATLIAPMGTVNPFTNIMALAIPACSAGSGVATSTASFASGQPQGVPIDPQDNMSPSERSKQNRDRNREHARSTRLRKKAYVAKLKELVEGLHSERTEEAKKRKVAIQSLAEMQNVRRAVVRSFLQYHTNYESDERKWATLLEERFWLKQPVTPYRAFRRSELETDCHISRGVQSVMCDAAR